MKREGLRGLEDQSRRPERFRRPQWSPELSEAVFELRERYPHWGKEKLVILSYMQEGRIPTTFASLIMPGEIPFNDHASCLIH